MAGASGVSLPWLVDLELQGFPAHVWETSTVEQFLNPLACIQQVHPETVALSDLSTVRCSASCKDPAEIPTTKELWVTEPPVTSMEVPSEKRLLVYPINIKCSILFGPGAPPSPPPPARDDDQEGPSARRRRRSSLPSSDVPPASQGRTGDDPRHGVLQDRGRGLLRRAVATWRPLPAPALWRPPRSALLRNRSRDSRGRALVKAPNPSVLRRTLLRPLPTARQQPPSLARWTKRPLL